MVEPWGLCDEHLQREHWEIHQLVEQVRGEWDMPGYNQTMKVLGHSVRGQVFPTKVRDRHDALVSEMVRRGIEHDTPIEQPVVADVLDMSSVTGELISHNKDELARRCSKCRDRNTTIK